MWRLSSVMGAILENAARRSRRLPCSCRALLLILLFILVPIAEIYVIIQVGQAIGALWTVLLLIVDSIIGARLLSLAGTAGVAALPGGARARAGCPHREVLDGVLIILGGAFLLTPGFITDIVGLAAADPADARSRSRRVLTRVLLRRGAASAGRTVVVRAGRPARPPPTADRVPVASAGAAARRPSSPPG